MSHAEAPVVEVLSMVSACLHCLLELCDGFDSAFFMVFSARSAHTQRRPHSPSAVAAQFASSHQSFAAMSSSSPVRAAAVSQEQLAPSAAKTEEAVTVAVEEVPGVSSAGTGIAGASPMQEGPAWQWAYSVPAPEAFSAAQSPAERNPPHPDAFFRYRQLLASVQSAAQAADTTAVALWALSASVPAASEVLARAIRESSPSLQVSVLYSGWQSLHF